MNLVYNKKAPKLPQKEARRFKEYYITLLKE